LLSKVTGFILLKKGYTKIHFAGYPFLIFFNL